MPVVLHTRLNDWLQCVQINKTIKNNKTEESGVISEVEYEHDNPDVSLDYASVNKSILYFDDCKAPIDTHLKTQQVEHWEHTRKICDIFSRQQPVEVRWHHKNFAYSGSFAKLSVSVKPIIPWLKKLVNWSYF